MRSHDMASMYHHSPHALLHLQLWNDLYTYSYLVGLAMPALVSCIGWLLVLVAGMLLGLGFGARSTAGFFFLVAFSLEVNPVSVPFGFGTPAHVPSSCGFSFFGF